MTYAVVYRFEGFTPRDMKAMQRHHRRAGGDLEHCDPSRFHLNEVIHGTHDWADELAAEVAAYKELNMRNEVAALKKRGRKKEAERRRIQGGIDPWKNSGTLGPVRGVVLTANAEWFRQEGFEDFEGADFRDPKKVQAFRDAAVAFLDKHIPREHCLFMVFETDERAPHIHAYYRAWSEKETKTKGVQRMLQPTDMKHFRNAEKAQDLVAEWFAPMGLVRGRRLAEERRRAKREGRMPPEKRHHITPWQWRQEERLTLIQAADQARAERAKADARIEAAEAAEERARKVKAAELEEVKKKQEEARLARIENGKRIRAEWKARQDAVAKREAEIAEREAAQDARDQDLDRRHKEQNQLARKILSTFDAVSALAEKVGMRDLELFKTAAGKVQELRDLIGKIGGRQRQR